MIARQSEIWTLLRRNISAGQMLGYVLSNVVGLTIILAGLLFYSDSRKTDDGDKFFTSDYAVLSKKVSGVGFSPVSFDEDDINKLKRQKWVKRVGRFTASQFAVNGAVSLRGKTLSTYLFFESVPDEFFDVKPRDWYFNPEDGFVPVILSKDYLTLYNFGFAVPQGLPQISEEMIGAVPVTLTITGKDNISDTFEAAVVGFSSRLNTIAVPQDFMDWANSRYYDGKMPQPSRLIVETDPLNSEDMLPYLQREELELAGDKEGAGNISSFLSVVSSVVTAGGMVISLLAFFILMLAISLLLQKSKDKLRYLMLLGYAPKSIGRYYECIVIASNMAVTVISFALAVIARGLWSSRLHAIGLGGAPLWPVLLAALTYLTVMTAVNIAVIRRKMRDIWAEG